MNQSGKAGSIIIEHTGFVLCLICGDYSLINYLFVLKAVFPICSIQILVSGLHIFAYTGFLQGEL